MTSFNQVPKRRATFMKVAHVIADLSSCISRCVGAVLVRDGMIISTGYNGTPKGVRNCSEGGCSRCSDATIASGEQLDKCLCLHAETNAVIQAAYNGISTQGAVLYCTVKPCLGCVKILINAGVRKVFYEQEYNVEYPKHLIENIIICKLEDV